MPEVMHSLVSDARRNRFSSILKLSEEDIISVWDAVSEYIGTQMCAQRAVHVPILGTFSFTQKKMEIGNNKFILIQRPVFLLSEKFSQTHALQYTKHHTTGEIPVIQLNFIAIAVETMFDRDTVETCVREVLQALSRAVSNQQNVDFLFRGIGVLSVKENKVKMKFFKDFLNSMDGSGNLIKVMENEVISVSPSIEDYLVTRGYEWNKQFERPGTADSVMSTQTTLSAQRRPGTSTVTFPRFNGSRDLLPPITEHAQDEGAGDKLPLPPSRNSHREVMRPHPVEAVSFNADDFQEAEPARESARAPSDANMSTPAIDSSPNSPTSPKYGSRMTSDENAYAEALARSSGEELTRPTTSRLRTPEPPTKRNRDGRIRTNVGGCRSPKHHHKSGHDLCYLCMQRSVRNIPVTFEEERKRKEMEQDALLQQYQQMKDHEAILVDKANQNSNRQANQKTAAFNLGVAECIREAKNAKSNEFVKSYLFQNRPLTPLRFYKQEEYSKALESQVKLRVSRESREKNDREFQERLEQVQLAEDLAAQREMFLRVKADQISQYQKALAAQIEANRQTRIQLEKSCMQLGCQQSQPIKPFGSAENACSRQRKVRSKPLPLPKAEPDSKKPLFGRYDATNEKLLEQKERARALLQNQLNMVSAKKKKMIMDQLTRQQDESEMLSRTKQELIEDRIGVHERAHEMRVSLEKNWKEHHASKIARENDEKMRSNSTGMLLLQQTEKYKRCRQCSRRHANCGESNIWSESRYVPGSRLMV